jgi:hypothetical protein
MISLRRLAQYRVAYKHVLVSYATLFAISGALVLALSTQVSLSGSRVGDVYRTGTYDKAYCAAGLCDQQLSRQLGPAQVADKDRASRDGLGSWLEEDGLRLLCEVRDGKFARGNR